MKVKEFADQQGVSSQAVYQRLKGLKSKTEKPLSAYIEPKTNELTGEAVEILTKLYRDKQQIKQIPTKTVESQVAELKSTIENLETRIKGLQEQVELKDKQINQLESQVEELKNDKQFLKTIAENLTKKPKQGFIKRLLSGNKETNS